MTSTQALGYGIDLGTSNSAVSVAYADRVEVLRIGPTRAVTTLPKGTSRRGAWANYLSVWVSYLRPVKA